jgi:sugar lactone lactonase YvrE
MSNQHLVLLLAAGLVGCATNSADDTMTGDDAPPFTNGVSTLSGAADPGFVDGPRGTARFANPVSVAYGPDGNVYVSDFDNGKIRVVDAETGDTSTLIAQGGFQRPFALAFAGDGTLYASTDNDSAGGHTLMSGTIWRVDVHAKTATVLAEGIGRPRGLVAMPDGRLVVSDYMHHVIEVVNTSSGAVTVLAGTWDVPGMVDGLTASKFSTPYGMALAPSGKLVVADFDNNRLRLVGLDGSVATLAGVGTAGFVDGSMLSAKFNQPQGVAIDASGDVFVTDLGNFRIRRLHGDSVDTVAGSGVAGYADDDNRLASELFGLEGMSLKSDGSMLFVADGSRGEAAPYNRIRSIKMN